MQKKRTRRKLAKRWVLGISARVIWTITSSLPLPVASEFGALFGRTFGRMLIKNSNINQNLRAAFPQLSGRKVRELEGSIAANVGRVMAEISHVRAFTSGKRFARIDLEGVDHLPTNRTAVFVGGHLSNWELGILALVRELGELNAIYTPIGVSELDRRLQAFRAETGGTYLPKTPASLRTIYQNLSEGRSVAMLVDQYVATGLKVNFLGHPSIAPALPARLAIKFDIPIIPVDGMRISPTHFVVRLHEPIFPQSFDKADREWAMTQQMMSSIEDFIRKSAGSWFCNKARWPTKTTS